MTTDEQKARRDRRSKIRRKGFSGIGEADVVGHFAHQRVPERLTVAEHKTDSGIIYSTKSDDAEQTVVEIGRELNSTEEGQDYVVAVVNKRTRTTEFRPARLFQFEARFSQDRAVTLGQKRSAPVDYSLDNNVSREAWAEKRSQLTSQFGSSMKRKIQEAAVRRSVNNEVLNEMVKTSFASETVIRNRDEIKLQDITLVQHAGSSILPPAVQAELPKDIYPLKMFVTAEDVELLREVAETALKQPRKELLERGWPDVVFKTCPLYSQFTGAKAVGFVLLACQAYSLGIMTRGKSIGKKELEAFPFPPEIVQKTQADYMPATFDRGVNSRGVARLVFTAEQRERLVAYTLALGLTLTVGFCLPVSPWQLTIAMPPKQIEKILTALGCTIGNCSTEEAVATGSIQSARLLRPPVLDKRTPKKPRR